MLFEVRAGAWQMASCELPLVSPSLTSLGHIGLLDTIVLHLRSSIIHLLDSQLAGLRLSVGLDPLVRRSPFFAKV